MSKHERYPIGRLFALATIALERAQEVAIEGQSPLLTSAAQRRIHRRLATALQRSQVAADKIRLALTQGDARD